MSVLPDLRRQLFNLTIARQRPINSLLLRTRDRLSRSLASEVEYVRAQIMSTLPNLEAPFINNMTPLQLGEGDYMPKDAFTLSCIPALKNLIDETAIKLPSGQVTCSMAESVERRVSDQVLLAGVRVACLKR